MNRAILAGVVLTGVTASIVAILKKQQVTPVVVASYVLLVILSLLDLFGGTMSRIAGAIALTAGLAVFLSYGFPILSLFSPQNLGSVSANLSSTLRGVPIVGQNNPTAGSLP